MRNPCPARFGISRCVATAVAASIAIHLATMGGTAEPIELSVVLDRLGRTAELYVDSAFRFTCRETVTHFTNRGRREYKFDYIYVRPDDGPLATDYRFPHRAKQPRKQKKQAKAARPVSLTDYGLPAFIDRPYMWVLFFDRSVQASGLYRYELAGQSQVLERRAVGLRFEPVPPLDDNVDNWFGTAWVDRITFQLLRVEAIHAVERPKKEHFERQLKAAQRAKHAHRSSHLFQQVYTDYGILRDGLRFPSEVMLRRSRYEVWGTQRNNGYQEFPVVRVRQSYSDYRFFGVETEQEIQSPPDLPG